MNIRNNQNCLFIDNRKLTVKVCILTYTPGKGKSKVRGAHKHSTDTVKNYNVV